MKTGPTINRGGSKQDYSTPRDFIEAVEKRFGPLAFDLAADAENTIVDNHFYDEAANALSQDWHKLAGNLWLNPPFSCIAPWAEKCAQESRFGARILFLTPASVGSNWFIDHVMPNAYVFALNPRLKFGGCKDQYPKDLILSVFGFGFTGFGAWRWK